METFKLNDAPGKKVIITGAGIVSSKIITTGSKSLHGYFSAVASSNSGGLTRRLWFSKTPAGEPIQHPYKFKGKTANAADVSGNEIKLSFTQGEPANSMQVKL